MKDPANPLEPLDPILAGLIKAERKRSGMPPSAKDAARAVIRHNIRTPPGPPPPEVGNLSSLARASRLTAVAFVVGTGVGAVAHARFAARRTAERLVYVTRYVDRPLAVPATAPPAVVDGGSTVITPPSPGTPERSANERSPRALRGPEPASDELNAERALLEIAHSALARGDGLAALVAVNRHAARFPHGQMAEERESLRVQALVAAGRFAEARAAGQQFQRRWGDGLLWPVVDAALRAIPQ